MCDLFEDDYKELVLGELTELWDNPIWQATPCSSVMGFPIKNLSGL